MPRKFIIDTDPGVDDAQAILMAHAHPDADLLGLTVVSGNVGIEHTVRNALTLVDVMQADYPVFPGCRQPLSIPGEDAAFVHGKDGFGDVGLPQPSARAETEHAANALVRLINDNPGEVTLVAIGPLTNVAVALLLDPDLPTKTERLVVMGGAVTGHGNVSNVGAEFNIYSDPEAAHLVFSGWPQFDLVDWEATLHHAYDFDVMDGWLGSGTAHARLYDQISQAIRRFVLSEGRTQMRAADALAMAVALEPQQIESAVSRPVAIELNGQLTRGQTVVDWFERTGRAANCRIVQQFNVARFLELNRLTFA